MRRTTIIAAAVIGGFCWAESARAGNTIAFQSGTVYVLANSPNDGPPYNSQAFSSIPYSTPVSETAGTATATSTPDLTSSFLALNTTGELSDKRSQEFFELDTFFVAPTSVTTNYLISGSCLVTGVGGTSEIEENAGAFLNDVTQNPNAPGIADPSPYNNSVTVQGTPGDPGIDTTGTLTPGDTYEFYVQIRLCLKTHKSVKTL
jgi:hypothetical protein